MFPDLPPPRNRPPRLLPHSYSPTELKTKITEGTGCVGDTFALTVEELDLADTLKSRWFIDRGAASPSYPGASVPAPAVNPTQRTIEAPASLLLGLASFVDSQYHVVEVFVTDSEFGLVPDEATRAPIMLPDGGTLEDTGYVVTKAWFVEVKPCN